MSRSVFKGASKKIYSAIDDVLNIRFVEPKAVSSYIDDLKNVLAEVMSLADKKPADALGLIRHSRKQEFGF